VLLRSALVLAILLALPATARAQQLDAGGELSTLELELQNDALEAETSDCATACRALDSMRRATERICRIDPGEPCLKARDKVARAEQRVRAACPDCAAGPRQEEVAKEAPPAPAEASPAAAPPQRGRGCAGCATSGDGDTKTTACLLGFAALAAALSRARSRR
jgi:hypothetical protein